MQLNLQISKRSENGKLDRLSGMIELDQLEREMVKRAAGIMSYAELFVTDCTKTVKVNEKIPLGNPFFSFNQVNFADVNSSLNIKGNLWVFAKANIDGSILVSSNIYKIAFDGTHSNELKRINAEIDSINEWIKFLTYVPDMLLPDNYIEDLVCEMSELAKEREKLIQKLAN